jgi:hypothetical protein
MWEPQHLTALWVSTARYRDIFTLLPYFKAVYEELLHIIYKYTKHGKAEH